MPALTLLTTADYRSESRQQIISNVLADAFALEYDLSRKHCYYDHQSPNVLKAAVHNLVALDPAFAQENLQCSLSRLLAKCHVQESDALIKEENARNISYQARAEWEKHKVHRWANLPQWLMNLGAEVELHRSKKGKVQRCGGIVQMALETIGGTTVLGDWCPPKRWYYWGFVDPEGPRTIVP